MQRRRLIGGAAALLVAAFGLALGLDRVLPGAPAQPLDWPPFAQATPPEARIAPRTPDLRVVMSGHSLSDPIAEPLADLVRAAGGPRDSVDLSTIPGSPMEWRWNNAPWHDVRDHMAEYDVLVLTERVSLSNTLPWHRSREVALDFARLAWEQGAQGRGGEVLLYASWVTRETGPDWAGQGADPDMALEWRARLDREMLGWEEIRHHVNAHRPEGAPPMRLIPAIAVMAAIDDAIRAGAAPITDIGVMFRDAIHPSVLGAWMVALTHYAVIYGRDPRGLTRPDGVAPQVAVWIEDLVWLVVTTHPATGVQA